MSLKVRHISPYNVLCVFWQERLTGGEYLVGGRGPFDGLGVLVVLADEGADVGLQFA